MYTGPAKASDPRVQIFTLGEIDVVTFYKKLTTYQRKFSSRMKTSAVRIKRLKDKEGIQASILKSPWHCIPDSLVAYQTWTDSGYGFSLEAESELLRYDPDPIMALLEGNLHDEDKIFTWNPTIPSYALGSSVHTTLWMYRMCSQFSNTGILPILEYFNRHEVYPMPKGLPYGRVRFKPEPYTVEGEKISLQPPGPKFHHERCFKIVHEEADIPIDESLFETPLEELLAEPLEYISTFEGTSGFKFQELSGQILTQKDVEEKTDAELADLLLSFDETANDHVNPDEPSGMADDLFNNSDDDLGFDLDAW
jgi:hypothetical protein